MGYSKEHVERTRSEILDAAGRLMRARGVAGVSVSQIMSEAGLTHGGFYAHFKSKEALFEEVVGQDFDFRNQLDNLANRPDLADKNRALIASEYYLDPAMSEKVAKACTMAASAQEVARSKPGTKAAFGRALRRLVKTFSASTGGKADTTIPESNAMAAIATCVGGLVLARSLSDQQQIEDLLAACASNARDLVTDDVSA